MSDLYSILGLTRACTQDDVRRAYKRLAVRWHPDKNPENREHAEREFKKVSEAYEVLSDPQKRAVYDRYGLEGLRGQAGRGTSAQMHDPFELFNMFFGGTDPFAAFDGRARGSRSRHTGGFDDDFGFGMGGFGGLSSMMNMMSRMSMHDDFGSMGGMGGGSFQMSSMSMGGMGGTSKHVSQQTVIRDGKQVTRKVTRTTQPDGTVHEDVEESIDDVPTSRRLAGGSTRRQQPSYHPALSHY